MSCRTASAALAVLSLALLGCGGDKADSQATSDELLDPEVASLVLGLAARPVLPADPTNAVADDATAAWFGRYLYFDPRLSGTGAFSCATCHDPAQGFGDGLAVSEAAGTTGRHAPTVWNSGYQRWLFWDGRCDSLWCQATGPIEAPNEMDLTRLQLVRVIAEADDLKDGYEAIFGGLPDVSDPARFPERGRPVPDSPDDPDHLAWQSMTLADQDSVTEVLVQTAKAIAAYERTLVTGVTPVDTFIDAWDAGDLAAAESALTESERRGLHRFGGDGNCVFCHAGWLTSNKEFHNVGLPEADSADPLDTGRYDGITAVRAHEFNSVSKWSDDPSGAAASNLDHLAQTADNLAHRTPSLRQIADHAPYMHGGHFATLAEVVDFYADAEPYDGPGHREELIDSQDWTDQDRADLVAFLEAMSAAPLPAADLVEPPDTPLP